MLDESFDLRPEVGIALALHVAGCEDAVPPGGFGALDGSFLVIHTVVAEDVGSGGVGGGDLALAMNNALGLVEVYGFSNVVGNDGIVLPNFGDAIDLHRQQNRNALAPEIAGEQDCGGRSPTVAEQDNVSASFFFGGKNAVAIGI